MRRRFEFQEGTSSKFWEIELERSSVTIWWDESVRAGQSKTLEFGSEMEAQAHCEQLIAEKTKKGYKEAHTSGGVIEFITKILKASDEGAAMDLLVDDDAKRFVFWVDWRSEDNAIASYCESVIQTGKLSSEFIDAATDARYELCITYGTQRTTVPLKANHGDRHRALCGLNEALAREYEIRLCIASASGDCVAMLPLLLPIWTQLENLHGSDALAKHFEKLTPDNNFFGDEGVIGGAFDENRPAETQAKPPVQEPQESQELQRQREDEHKFCVACGRGDLEQVKVLLRDGADPNSRTLMGDPALVSAVRASNRVCMDVIKLLLEAGADLNAAGCMLPLQIAVNSEKWEVAQYLIERGANVNGATWLTDYERTKMGMVSKTLLAHFRSIGRQRQVDFLLQHGASMN